MFRDARSRWAAISLLVGQMVSASYFYSPASVYLYMGRDLGQNVSGLGLLTTAFIIGIGGFQIPAGLLAEKIGPRRTIIYGTFLAAVSTLLTGLPSQLVVLAFLRFLTGVGMAFIFAPSITLVARCFKKEFEGFGIGLVAGAFDLGGVIVIPGWAVLGRVEGWRLSFVVAGILGLLAIAAMIILVPREEVRSGFRFRISDLRRVLLNKWLLAIGLAALSVQVGWNTVGSFMVFYLENNFNTAPAIAGLVGSLFLFCALVSSPLAGRIYGRVGRPVRLLLTGGLFSAAGLGIAALMSPYAAVLSTAVVGAADGLGFTTAYILARD
ncbi:MAG: MFS transporter, partial [Thaumarchaeota archaeon]|nr:MFS transporter [Nitrososphaerota archaeon]